MSRMDTGHDVSAEVFFVYRTWDDLGAVLVWARAEG